MDRKSLLGPLGLLAAVSVLMLALTLLVLTRGSDHARHAQPGATVGELRLLKSDGTIFSLAQLRGQRVALYLLPEGRSATPECVHALLELSTQATVVIVCSDPADPLLASNVPLTTLLDRTASVANRFLVFREPAVILVDEQGIIEHRGPLDAGL